MTKKLILCFTIFIGISLNSFVYADQKIADKNDPSKIKDCHEGINKTIFGINKRLDNIIFEPAAKAYRILPSQIRSGVSNSLNNLSNLVTIPNNILQGELQKAGSNTGRFILNTTVGILGVIDVAEKIGFEKYEKEDYGQSLAKQGVGPNSLFC